MDTQDPFDFDSTLRQIEGVLDKQLFFVCGVLKSGTTWLERLLDAHPEIVCKGEAHFGSDFFRPLANIIETYNNKVALKGGAVAHLKEYGGATDVLSFDTNDLSFLSVSAVLLMFAKWSRNGAVKCIGDKTPSNLKYMRELSALFPNAKFLHIIRDGRDVAVSLWHFNMMTDIGRTIQNWGTFENFTREFAVNWGEQVLNGREAGAVLGRERYLEITYEHLASKPDACLEEIYRFLGVANSEDVISKCVDACSFEKLSGGRKKGEEDSGSFYRKGISGDWKNHFKPDQLAEFHATSKGMLQDLGYIE